MEILSEVKKITSIDIDSFISRLETELDVKPKYVEQLHYAIFDICNIIISVTHLKKIDTTLYTTLFRMVKDYWYISGYDKLLKSKDIANEKVEELPEIKSIAIGDTTTTFQDNSSKIDINGIKFETTEINPLSTDILLEKYKNELYRFRRMRW